MKQLIIKTAICFLASTTMAIAQNNPTQNLSTQVKSAIVYLDGAEISQSKTVNLNAGRTVLTFIGLSSKLISKSVQATATGDVTILSISDRINYLNPSKESARVKQIKDSMAFFSESNAQLNYDKDAFEIEKRMIVSNQAIGGNEKGVSVAELKLAADFFRTRMKEINTELNKITAKMTKNNEQLEKLQLTLGELDAESTQPSAEVEILVSTNLKTSSTIDLKYIVGNAGWTPSYDLIAEDINKPIDLKYRAKVYNNTDIDWTDIKLKLSTADPLKSASKPNLTTWNLNFGNAGYFDNNQVYGLIGGRVQEQSQNYMNNAPSQLNNNDVYLQSVPGVVNGQSFKNGKKATKPQITLEEVSVSELSAEFDIKNPYTIPSDSKPYLVDVTSYNLPASYKHFAVPKIEKEAFMLARITGWEDLDLVEGPANIYFGGTYVGQSYIKTRSIEDTLDLSLGRDKKITVTRTKLKDFNKEKVTGNNRKVTYSYEIVVKNNRKAAVNVDIEDQLPISQSSDIVVESIEISKADQDLATGKLTWKLNLQPDEVKKIILTYSVKYPRDREVNFDNNKRKAYRAKF